MWHLVWTTAFDRRCRRLLPRNRDLEVALATALARLVENPHDPKLKLHRLHGDLEGLWAVRVTFSVRLVLDLDQSQHEITLLALAAHDEAYGS